jgi:hypothetical protein
VYFASWRNDQGGLSATNAVGCRDSIFPKNPSKTLGTSWSQGSKMLNRVDKEMSP